MVLPCLAMGGALLVGSGLRAAAARGRRLQRPVRAGVGPDVPAELSFGRGLVLHRGARSRGARRCGRARRRAFRPTLATANTAGKFSFLLGGVPKAGTPTTTFEFLVRQLGFGLFPWSAVAVFALGRPLIRLGGGSEPDGDRLAFVQLYLLVFAAFGFALSSYFVLVIGEARYVALAPIALAIGAFLDEALEGERAEPVLGLLMATGTMVVARDFVLTPEELVSVHPWPRFTGRRP